MLFFPFPLNIFSSSFPNTTTCSIPTKIDCLLLRPKYPKTFASKHIVRKKQSSYCYRLGKRFEGLFFDQNEFYIKRGCVVYNCWCLSFPHSFNKTTRSLDYILKTFHIAEGNCSVACRDRLPTS